jgi:hypothetical protein
VDVDKSYAATVTRMSHCPVATRHYRLRPMIRGTGTDLKMVRLSAAQGRAKRDSVGF